MILHPAMSTHNHSVSGDWLTSDYSNCSWTSMARSCLLLRTDPAIVKLGITSLSAVVQWVSWRRWWMSCFCGL